MFVEIKKCPLPDSYEQGDDVKVLQALGDGMLYAQEQILWHELRLKEKGVIELYDPEGNWLMDYSPGKKRIMAVSICMPEYDFLTDRSITEAFLESTLLVTYHTVDPNREALLKKLNKRAGTIQMVAGRLFDGKPFDVKEVFLNHNSEACSKFGLCCSFAGQWRSFWICAVSSCFLLPERRMSMWKF